MRCILTLLAGLAALALGACAAEERPIRLSGALFHSFTLVDLDAGKMIPDAWVVLAEGRIIRQGEGAPPSDDFIAEIDLSGARVMTGESGEISFVDGRPLTDMTQASTAFVMGEDALHGADPLGRPCDGGRASRLPRNPIRDGD